MKKSYQVKELKLKGKWEQVCNIDWVKPLCHRGNLMYGLTIIELSEKERKELDL